MNSPKARIFKARIIDRWIYEVPIPGGIGPVRGSTLSHLGAIVRVDILIRAWWHR